MMTGGIDGAWVGSEIDDERLEGVSVKDLMSTTIFPIAPSMRERSAMHYTGTIWRPPYEATCSSSRRRRVASHHRCKFCTLYERIRRLLRCRPWEDIEADLWKRRRGYHDPLRKAEEHLFELPGARASRIFLAGANPFGLKALHLRKIASLVRTYFPQCKSIGCFSRVTDVAAKTDEELAELAAAGFDGLTIGIETGDEEALAFMDKGYGAEEIIVEQERTARCCGISYAFSYLVGISTPDAAWWSASDGGCSRKPDEPLGSSARTCSPSTVARRCTGRSRLGGGARRPRWRNMRR